MSDFDVADDYVPRAGFKRMSKSESRVEARLALSDSLRETAFEIRYAAYRANDYIGDLPNQRFSDIYDDPALTRTILVYKNGLAAATVRVGGCDYQGNLEGFYAFQAMEIFETDVITTVEAHRTKDRWPKVAEVSKLARLPEYAGDSDIIFALYRAAGYLILHNDVDIVFNAVRPHHVPLYRRFGFKPLTLPRPYPCLSYKAVLMACFRRDYDAALRSLPFLQGLSTEDSIYAGLLAGERVEFRAVTRMTRSTEDI